MTGSVENLSPELQARLVSLARDMAGRIGREGCSTVISCDPADYYAAKEIVAELPEPIDPDWEIAAEIVRKHTFTVHAFEYRTEGSAHTAVYEALKLGRSLSNQERQ